LKHSVAVSSCEFSLYPELSLNVAFLDNSFGEYYNKTSVWNGKWEILKRETKSMHIVWIKEQYS
jgi:hypothetical protein